MPKIFNKITGRVEEVPYDEEGINRVNQIQKTGQGTTYADSITNNQSRGTMSKQRQSPNFIMTDARKRSEKTYG